MLCVTAGRSQIRVVTSLSDLADFAKEVGGDRVEVDHLVRGAQNPHYIEVKPSYMLKLKRAQIFFIIGMQLELWAPQIIDGSRNPDLLVVDCSRNIQKLEVPTTRLDASAGDVHPFGNPHYWLDPENVGTILEEMVEALSSVSPGDETYFRANMQSYLDRLKEKTSEWIKITEPIRGRQFVSYHSSFSYFAKRFGLTVAGYVEPKPGIPPTPSHVAELIEAMRRGKIRVIGVEQYFEDSTPRRIAQAVDGVAVRLGTSVGGVEGADDYIGLMEYDVRTLAKALKEYGK
jgi:ABC-type Zn uptake system ZnuABC Zn-binding protein ZnuA